MLGDCGRASGFSVRARGSEHGFLALGARCQVLTFYFLGLKVTSYSYDKRGLITRADSPVGSSDYTFDAGGNVVETVLGNGRYSTTSVFVRSRRSPPRWRGDPPTRGQPVRGALDVAAVAFG
jgi:hypothetical protein